jgi:hypothetical protein
MGGMGGMGGGGVVGLGVSVCLISSVMCKSIRPMAKLPTTSYTS